MLRKMIAGLLSLVLVFACCGCSGASAQQAIPEDIFAEELATDELVVYNWKKHPDPGVYDSFWRELLSGAIRLMQTKHGVTVTYREIDYDEYDDILTVDLMAGKGPDVVLWENMREDLFSDPVKVIESGAFLDLNPLFEQDPEFSFTDYSPAIDAGLYNGGRYYVPLCYLLGTTTTLDERIEKYDFPWTRYPTYDEYTENLLAYIRQQPTNVLKKSTKDYSWYRNTYLYTSGLQLIDFETQTILPDREGLRKVADFCKEMDPYLIDADPIQTYKSVSQEWMGYVLDDPNCVFLTHYHPWHAYWGNGEVGQQDILWQVGAMPTVQDSKPVAIPGISAAIRNGTPNLQNAYYFMQFLLSEAMQSKFADCLPVNLSRAKHTIEWGSSLHTPEEFQHRDELVETLTDVVPYKQFSTKQWELFVQYMTPYWEGNASYEECVADLESMLELYMYE